MAAPSLAGRDALIRAGSVSEAHVRGAGLLALRRAGWHTIAQDEASSVVYGMPKAAAKLGAAIEILAASAIAPSLLRHAR